MAISTVEEILEDFRLGKMVLVMDDEDRENEGDLVIPAATATPEAINFMAKEGRGLICLPMSGTECDRLGLRAQTETNTSRMGTAFTVSIEARQGVTTGISAADRAVKMQIIKNRLVDLGLPADADVIQSMMDSQTDMVKPQSTPVSPRIAEPGSARQIPANNADDLD